MTYPNFVAALEGRDLYALSDKSGVSIATITAVARPGGPGLAQGERIRLARALEVDPAVLWRVDAVAEPALPAGPKRHVTDPAILRAIDRQTA